jgi:plastocyanin
MRIRALPWLGLIAFAVGTGVAILPAALADRTVPENMTEFAFDNASVTAQAGETVHFALVNAGQFPHSLAFDQADGVHVLAEPEDAVAPGDSGMVDVTFSAPGTYTFFCPVPGHRERGMVGMVTVTAAQVSATPSPQPTVAPTAAPTAPPTPTAPAPRARDGQSLDTQTPATRARFIAVWGAQAGTEWVKEHEAAIGGH